MQTEYSNDHRKEAHTPNTGLAKVAVQCSADTFVGNQSLVLRINICGEKPPSPSPKTLYSMVEINMPPSHKLFLHTHI